MDILALYETHKNMVYRLALSYMKSPAEAEDICQNAFLRLMERGGAVAPGKERAWLATVTANLCKDALRSVWRRMEELPPEIPFETPEQGDLFRAVMALPAKERAAVYLHYYEGFSTGETAKILKTSQSAVTTGLHRARKKLRTMLEAEDGIVS